MRRAIGWIIAVVIVGAIGLRLFQAGRQRTAGLRSTELKRETAAVPVSVAMAGTGTISSTLFFVGTIKGEDQVEVFSEAPGKLIRYTVREGDRVGESQLLALVDRAVTGMHFEPLRVKSPISGVAGRLFLDRGSAISPQVPIATVVKMDRVRAVFSVGEKELAKVKTGIKAEVRVDTYPGEVFIGELSRISPLIDPMTRSASSEVILPNRGHKLKPGMFADITLIIETHSSALLVERDAIVEDLAQGKSYLFVVEGDSAERKEVKTGIVRADTAEVVSGIEQGNRVIVKGQHYLQGGERVEVID